MKNELFNELLKSMHEMDREHIAAKNKARSTWLEDWQIRICRIEDIYGKS